MKASTSKAAGESRKSQPRAPTSERRVAVRRSAASEEHGAEDDGLGAAMVDALEDILQWERASERALQVAESANDT